MKISIRGGRFLASSAELDLFLRSVERRAFRQAAFALRDDEAALDAVQESMMRLAQSYGSRPADEFPMLFQRILQNAVRDSLRRRRVRDTWVSFFSAWKPSGQGEDEALGDPLEVLEIGRDRSPGSDPARAMEQVEGMAIIEAEIARLPTRQREAFLLRYWEELDTAETAAVMQCSEGSVKTHCSRAVRALAQALKAKGIEP